MCCDTTVVLVLTDSRTPLPERGSDPACSLPLCLLPCTAGRAHSSPGCSEKESDALTPSFEDINRNYGNNSFTSGDLSPYLPCCTGQRCEAPCSLRHLERRFPPRKTTDAPSAAQNRSGRPLLSRIKRYRKVTS